MHTAVEESTRGVVQSAPYVFSYSGLRWVGPHDDHVGTGLRGVAGVSVSISCYVPHVLSFYLKVEHALGDADDMNA